MSIPTPAQGVQTSVPQPQCMISIKLNMPPGSGDNNNTSPKVSAPKPLDLMQKDKSNVRRSSRMSKPNRKYINIVSLVKNTFEDILIC